MRKGCVSLCDIQCDGCQRTVAHSERYLAIDDEDDTEEAGSGKLTYYCVQCALDRGLAFYRDEKGERMLTFFPQSQF